MTVYENIVIGTFLFDFGVRMGKAAPGLPMMGVNMLQQCPWDQKIGDVLLSNASICRIVEFKRKKNRSKKEIDKRDKLAAGIAQSNAPEFVEHLSREIHWYVEVDDVREQELAFETRVVPYLDFVCPEEYIDLLQFADETARQACRPALDESERHNYSTYLRFVVDINNQVGIDADARVSSGEGAALVVATTCKGELKWLAAKELRYLFMTRHELEIELKIDLGPELKQDIEHKIDQAFGFGM